MAKRSREAQEISLPEWAKQDQWFRQEEMVVPVEEPVTPWYMEQAVLPQADTKTDAIERRYFRTLVSLLDERGWQSGVIASVVETWLARHDHYRFVSMVRPVSADWHDILLDVGVPSSQAANLVREINSQLNR